MKKTLVLVGTLFLFIDSWGAIIAVDDEAAWQTNFPQITLAGFEGFLGSVTDQYSGITFSGFHGGTPKAVAEFPYQGSNSMCTTEPTNAGGGGWAVDFETPVNGVGFRAGDVEFSDSTISFRTSSHELIDTFDILASGGDHGEFVYGFNGYVSDAYDIARIELAIASSDAIWFDNFRHPIPLPPTILLLALGGLAVVRRRDRK